MKGLLKSIYRFFRPEITHHWCLTNAIGNKYWFAELKRCRNGTPKGAGWFIDMIKLDGETTEGEARKAASEMNKEIEAQDYYEK